MDAVTLRGLVEIFNITMATLFCILYSISKICTYKYNAICSRFNVLECTHIGAECLEVHVNAVTLQGDV